MYYIASDNQNCQLTEHPINVNEYNVEGLSNIEGVSGFYSQPQSTASSSVPSCQVSKISIGISGSDAITSATAADNSGNGNGNGLEELIAFEPPIIFSRVGIKDKRSVPGSQTSCVSTTSISQPQPAASQALSISSTSSTSAALSVGLSVDNSIPTLYTSSTGNCS
ncbi:unnamed protein product [Protopolystoma xenopodis]|uniref:Uncharacterized protein n=1 Tax=Protopolystoma xenopodis TaxID=117903 RepID=A0A3S5CVA8_9PLAT|nr:unnamed protein product [Protopolystoma xenopodis]